MKKATMKFDHSYVSAKDLTRAIKFYEDLLGRKISNYEENRWADFDLGDGCYFGLINPDIISNKRIVGNNSVVAFWTDDVDAVYEKVKTYKDVKIKDKPENLDFTDYYYRCFQFYDTEGNLIEVAKYDK